MTRLEEKARAFHALHHGPRILVLLNAWDVASARVFELAGAPAIATTSAGVANSLGFPDGEHLSRELLMEAVARITRAVDVPVSVDVEAGYGATADDVRATARAVLDAGGIGVNIEDAMMDPDHLVERIAAIRDVAAAKGVPLFVNARTDVYLRGTGQPPELLDEAVRRLRAYAAAGADGLFAPGLRDPATIARIVAAVGLPLNILAGEGVPPAKELERLGVRRVSVGSGPMRATLGLVRRIGDELLRDGTYTGFLAGAPSHADVNRMLAKAP
jgi:2-methylisocitrate lyase-like PEP mutase family enzyme